MTLTITAVEPLYKGWSTLSKVTLSDGATTFHREVEDHGSAAAVLPYDAERRVALLVQMPRTPVMLSGAGEHLLEAPAGLIDEGETAETCARREAEEEGGLDLDVLEPLGAIWTCPGVSTERISLFLASYRQADRKGQGGGLADEHENIIVVEHALDALAALAEAGKLTDMKTLCLVQALRLRHPDLFTP